MKILVSIMAVVFFTGSCNSQKQASNLNQKTDMVSQSETLVQSEKEELNKKTKNTTFTYKAYSRGYYNYIFVSKDKIKSSNNPDLKDALTQAVESEDWETLISYLDKISLENLDKFEAPSNNRFSDGAAHATLTIVVGLEAFTSTIFDEGKPPKEIESLVNKMLALATKVKKQ